MLAFVLIFLYHYHRGQSAQQAYMIAIQVIDAAGQFRFLAELLEP